VKLSAALISLAHRRRDLAHHAVISANIPELPHSGCRFFLRPEPPPDLSLHHGLPTHGVISSRFGMRLHPVKHRMIRHRGVDIAADLGTPVWATAAGRVTRVEHLHGYGLTVQIDHGAGTDTLYAHLQSVTVRVGDTVAAGDIIGTVGQTGNATAPSLHFEVRQNGEAVDPMRG